MVGNGRRKQLIWVPQPLSPPPKSENKKVQKHCKQKASVPTSGGQMLIFQWQPITSSTWRLYFHFHLSPCTMTAYYLFHFPQYIACLHVEWQPINYFTFGFTFTFHNALLFSTSSGNLLSPPTFSSFCHCPIWTIAQHSYFFCKKYFSRHFLFFTFSIFSFHPMPSFPESLTVQRPVHFNQTCHIRHHSNTFPANSNQKNEGKGFTEIV